MTSTVASSERAGATYRHVQGLSRGLSVLRALNAADPCGATPRELSQATRLNRTTVKRILETLVDEGYVRPCDCEGSYGLSPEVVTLSRGLTEDASLLRHASPIMRELGRRTRWSLRLATMKDDSVVIRDSTHPESELAFESWGGLRHRLPMLLSAAGRACFAHCDAADRQRIVHDIRLRHDEQWPLANNDKLIDLMTRRVLDDGYALNDGDWGERRLGAVAVPIRRPDGRPVASLSLLYTRSAVSRHAIDREFLPALRESIAHVEGHL